MTPRVLPSSNVPNPYLQYWFPMSLSDESLFKAILLSSLTHETMNTLISTDLTNMSSHSDIMPHLKECYLDTVNSINEALRDPIRATTDATILAVLMTVEKPIDQYNENWQRSPFRAPLQGLQWLNVHSARQPNLPHQDGLCRIVNLRGGLSNIGTPGVAAAVF